MEWSERIDNRKYLIGSVIGLLAGALVARGQWIDMLILWGVVFVAAANQWLLFRALAYALRRMLQSDEVPNPGRGQLIMMGQIILKLGLLAGAFYYVVGYARHLVPYALVLFTFQLIILVLSIKNKGAFPK